MTEIFESNRVVAAVLLLLGTLLAPHLQQENPLLAQIRGEFQERSKTIERVRILEMQAPQGHAWEIDWPYVILAHGIRQDGVFRGSFDDELFGIFLADPALERIVGTVEIIPTPRWSDYLFTIESLQWPELVVHGVGATYGDHEQRWTYDLSRFESPNAR